jgi:anaerobic selenocysteine-containing dehydrogenase
MEVSCMKVAGSTDIVKTVCRIECGANCRIQAHLKNGVVTKVDPLEFPIPGMRHICLKALASVNDILYHPDRLKYPLKRLGERGKGPWVRISWEEALEIIVRRFKDIGEKYGFQSIAFLPGQLWTSSLMGIYQRLASALEASWVNLSGFGDAAGPSGDMISYGIPIGNHYTELDKPKLCVIWGGNYTETQPLEWRKIRNLKEQGVKLVVIDPRFTTTASKADQYVNIRPGTDGALALGMIHVILDKGLADVSFLSTYTVAPFLVRGDNGHFLRERDIVPGGSEKYMIWDSLRQAPCPFDTPGIEAALNGVFSIAACECRPSFQLLADMVRQYPPHRVAEITGIPVATIEELATEYGTRKPVNCHRGWGMQRTFHGDLSWRAVTTLAAVTGNIKLEGYRSFRLNRDDFVKLGEKSFKYMNLYNLYEGIEIGKPYPIKSLFIAAHNPMNQYPNQNKFLKELLPHIDFIVTVDNFNTLSAEYSDIVLPAATFYEYMDLIPPFDSNNEWLQIQRKVIEPLYESKSHVWIASELGRRMGYGEYFTKNDEAYIDSLLASEHVSLDGITLEKLKEAPALLPHYDVPCFTTPSGRLEFYSEAMKPFGEELPVYKEPIESARSDLARKYPLSLLNGHTRYRKCTMLTNSPVLRSLDPEPMLEIHPTDAQKREINDGDWVVVWNDRGRVKLKSRLHHGIREGVVNIKHGWRRQDYQEGSHQELSHYFMNPAQAGAFEPNAALYDILVQVAKAEENT